MNRHTPEPWDLIPNGRDSKRLTDCRYGEERKCIGIIYTASEEEKANADLIKAAPQLLSALHIALMQIKADYNTRIQQPVERDANKVIIAAIEEVLAKAEGRHE